MWALHSTAGGPWGRPFPAACRSVQLLEQRRQPEPSWMCFRSPPLNLRLGPPEWEEQHNCHRSFWANGSPDQDPGSQPLWTIYPDAWPKDTWAPPKL